MSTANGKFGSSGMHGMLLYIQHVPTGLIVEFPAFLENFSDQYSSHWNKEHVFGRMDPISTFSHTERNLSLAWHVPAESFEDAQRNLTKANKLMSFLYPLYDSTSAGGATAMNMGPLLRLKFGNLVQSANGGGLLGWVNGFTFDPMLEYGMFHKKSDKAATAGNNTSAVPTADVEYYPKTYRLNCELNVLHEHKLGFEPNKTSGSKSKFSLRSSNGKGNQNNFPYEVGNAPPHTGILSAQWNSENKGPVEASDPNYQRALDLAIRSNSTLGGRDRISAAVNQTILFPSKEEK